MREIRPSGLEGGGAVTPLCLPLSFARAATTLNRYRLSSLPVCRTFQSGGRKTGDSKVARTRRLESLRYEPVPVRGPNAFQKEMEALHEPQGAAGILPAEDSERSSADETSAAPCWRHGSTCSRFIVLMHA